MTIRKTEKRSYCCLGRGTQRYQGRWREAEAERGAARFS